MRQLKKEQQEYANKNLYSKKIKKAKQSHTHSLQILKIKLKKSAELF